jgi:hypothetical protein
MKRALLSLVAVTLTLIASRASAQINPVPPVMNFQGRLTRADGTPVPDGNYTIRFSLHTAATGGTEKWNQVFTDVPIRNGIIAILIGLLVPPIFDDDLWLEIKLGNNQPLAPRQRLATVPYAFKANRVADGAITTSSLANSAVTGAKIAPGTITLSNLATGLLDFWRLTGNSGTTSNNFLGTLDNQPLILKVNDRRAMRYAFKEDTSVAGFEYRTINVLGGASVNEIGANVLGATIAGGGQDYHTLSDNPNRVLDNFGTVGGGAGNTAGGPYATVAGGYKNSAENEYSVVSGGRMNVASSTAATVIGGSDNIASGSYSAVLGGFDNEATGAYSVAMGRHAKANHTAFFIFNTNLGDFSSTASNQFLIWADAGVGIGTNNPRALLDVSGNAHFALDVGIGTTNPLTKLHVVGSLHLEGTTQDISVPPGNNLQVGHYDGTTFTERIRMDGQGHVGINDTNPTYRLELPNIASDGDGRARANRWDTYSSGRWKHNVMPIENALEKVLRMRGVMFDWNLENGGAHDIGFVTEEVGQVVPELVSWEEKGKTAFGMAYDRVTALLVEAIKAQQKQIKARDAQIKRLETDNATREARLQALEEAVCALTERK